MEINFFNETVEDFIAGLEKPTYAKILRTLDLLKDYGPLLGMPHSKKISVKLFELRVRGKQEVRILYCFKKGIVILLHAFIKKTQKIPKNFISLAEARLKSLDPI